MIGLEITKYDRAGLQIAIGFGLQSAIKIKKMDCKMRWDNKAGWITK